MRLLAILALVGFSGLSFMVLACHFDSPFRDTILARDIDFSKEWIVVDGADKIKLAGDHQFVSIIFEKPLSAPYGVDGIVSGTGTVFNPEIRLVDEKKNEYELVYEGKLGNQRTHYKFKTKPTAPVKFSKILVRSDIPFKARTVVWTYFYSRDLH